MTMNCIDVYPPELETNECKCAIKMNDIEIPPPHSDELENNYI